MMLPYSHAPEVTDVYRTASGVLYRQDLADSDLIMKRRSFAETFSWIRLTYVL